MLAARHAAERLQNCWHGGARSTGQLRDAMSAALAEYVISGDSTEAARCLAELDVPHFHHELVKCAVVAALTSAVAVSSRVGRSHLLRDSEPSFKFCY